MIKQKGVLFQDKNIWGQIITGLTMFLVMFLFVMPMSAGSIAIDSEEILAEVEISSEHTVVIKGATATSQRSFIAGSPRVLEEEEVVGLDVGADIIPLETADLVKYDLPSKYYSSMDFSTMQPYMGYTTITNKNSPSYKVSHAAECYTDENGYRRYKVDVNEFSLHGIDDYVIALGTYYKEKGKCGDRWLIVTSKGMYTARTGDEKADRDTDSRHMVHPHGNGKYSLIEFIVDSKTLEPAAKRMGSVYYSELDDIGGEILYMYHIEP